MKPTFSLASWLFLRLLGVAYVFAFLSLGLQIPGLIGADGIVPASEYLADAAEWADAGGIGVDRYLTKPIDTDLLFREVGALIEQRKSHKRVLVVDEDASTVKSLSDVLTARGYSVSETRGEDLVERARALQPDIILLNSVSSARSDAVQMLRFEKGLDHVLFLVYQ